ncbi:2522_t:CDS:2 [Ambispora leptoticha]|uniref:2522_t:CDS:1 n=1 Tax=Ambispora leptoticha TaxID=144679 RepID=A0A9N8W9F9_9GLOM|nr:2522_t:CDS:2 [Ambispora leptoticha]
MSQAQALIFGQIKHANKTLAELKDRHIIFEYNGTKQEFISSTPKFYDNISAILYYATEADRSINKIDKEILSVLPTSVILILVIGDARESVDIETATELGIAVSDTNSTLTGSLSQEEIEKKALEILDDTLLTNTPANPINDIEVVEKNAMERVKGLINSLGTFDEFDVTNGVQFFN